MYYGHRNLCAFSWFFGQNMTFALPKNMCVMKNTNDESVISFLWVSNWWPSGFNAGECYWVILYILTQIPYLDVNELGLLISTTYYQSKRFFSIFWNFDVKLKRFDLWKHLRNVACSFHSWKFQRVDSYTAWSNSTKYVEGRDRPNHGQTCRHRFVDVIWRIPNHILSRPGCSGGDEPGFEAIWGCVQKRRTVIGHEPLMCSKMCFTKTKLVQ